MVVAVNLGSTGAVEGDITFYSAADKRGGQRLEEKGKSSFKYAVKKNSARRSFYIRMMGVCRDYFTRAY